MNIVGIAPFYPTKYRPESGVFIHSLFEEMRDQGNSVNTIAPLSWSQKLFDPFVRNKNDINWVNPDNLKRPQYSNLLLHFFPHSLWAYRKTQTNFQNAVQKGFSEIKGKIDWVYAHFFMSGAACADICASRKIPCIVGLGESNLENVEKYWGTTTFAEVLQSFTGVIAVSQENERFCRDRCPSIGEKLIYIPNGVDTKKFCGRDQTTVRKQLGLPLQVPIVLFCGHFIERKGPFRVQEALDILPGFYGVFLGQGTQIPKGAQVLYAGPVPHNQIHLWFAAADVFVLPSLAEGMSNAILEALASGLPLVVSDRPFNHDFLSSECTVFVDPYSPQSIASGIKSVFLDSKRKEKMSKYSLALAQDYSLSKRVYRIIEFSLNRSEKFG